MSLIDGRLMANLMAKKSKTNLMKNQNNFKFISLTFNIVIV